MIKKTFIITNRNLRKHPTHIESGFVIPGKSEEFAIVPRPMAPALKKEFPEIEAFVRFS